MKKAKKIIDKKEKLKNKIKKIMEGTNTSSIIVNNDIEYEIDPI